MDLGVHPPSGGQQIAAAAASRRGGSRGEELKQQYDRDDSLFTSSVEMTMTGAAEDNDDVTVPLIFAESSGKDDGANHNTVSREPKYTVEDAIEHVGFGKYQIILVAYVGLTWMADAAEMILLSFIGPAARCEWNLSPGQEGVVSSAVFAGVFAGAYSWGLLADLKGRKIAVLATAVFTSAFGVLSALSPSFWWLLLSRALVGFGLGGSVVAFALFMEFLPVRRRGFWLVFLEFFWTVGSIAEALLAWVIIPNMNWRWLVAVSALPFVCLVLFYPLVPESPKYLMVKGDSDGAMNILRQMAKTNGKSLPVGRLIPSPQSATPSPSKLKDVKSMAEAVESAQVEAVENADHSKVVGLVDTVKLLFSPELRRTTLVLWFLYFANSFVYYGLVLLTTQLDVKDGKEHRCDDPSNSMMNEARTCYDDGKPVYDTAQYRAALISSIAEVPGVIVACLIVDWFGRKLSLFGLLIACGAFMLPLLTPLSEVATNFFMFGARSCSMGGFSVLWAYAPELYYTQVRSTGVGAANSQGRLGGFLCPFVAVGLLESCERILSVGAFAFFAVLAGLAPFCLPKEIKVRNVSDRQ